MGTVEDPRRALALELELHPKGSLFCGGYSTAQGASGGETASDRRGLLIPASAVKGALRETALRLVHAAGQGDGAFASLFGDEFSESEGKLCFGLLRPPDDVGRQLSTRHHVSLSRATRSAVPGHLFDQRVVSAGLDLVFRGQIELRRELDDEEWQLLKLAAEMTDRIGAGRGRGLGQVEIRLGIPCSGSPHATADAPESGASTVVREDKTSADEATREVVFQIEVVEPMKLGRVKDRSNVEATDEIMRGSMFRGAVAGGLLRVLRATPEHPLMDLVFAEPNAVIFGDGHPVPSNEGSASDLVPAPLTLKESKAGGSPTDEALALVHDRLAPDARSIKPRLGLRAAKGSWAKSSVTWGRVKVPRRLLTRLARDPASGRAADGRLYSLDVIDPGAPSGDAESAPAETTSPETKSLRYQLPVRGTSEQIEWVRRAFEGHVRVGGTRSRGLGRVGLCRILPCQIGSLEERHTAWVRTLVSASAPESRATSTGVLLALGPVALPQPLLEHELAQHRLKLVGGRSKRRLMGGWNSQAKLPRRTGSAFVAGSVWLVETEDGSSALPALDALEEAGLGPGRADGWGRLVACHRIHLELSDLSKGAKDE